MTSYQLRPVNLPETLVWYYIIGTYLSYLLGGQYVFAPLLATVLVFFVLKQWWHQTAKTSPSERIALCPSTWIWIVAMLIMEVALIIGHINFDFTIIQIAKSSLYWYRHWALFALFPVAAYLKIRPQIIYRASCIFGFQCLVLVLLGNLAYLVNLPILSYVSPFQVFGGDDMYYRVSLLFPEPGYEKEFRLQLFAPWPPALGLMGNIYFFLAYQETNQKWRWLGMLGAIAMIISSVSRLAILCLLLVILVRWLVTNFFRTQVQLAASLSCFLMGILSSKLIEWFEELKVSFYKFRPGSSQVRAALGRITLDRWWNEAPIWGHGINISRGPASLGFMPIGTHHTWYGVLYLHGLVGFFCFAIPFLLSAVDLLSRVKNSQIARVAFSLMLVLFLFSFGENIENLSYLYWQALLIIGIALKGNAQQLARNQKPLLLDSNSGA
jgi:hypothetical protein